MKRFGICTVFSLLLTILMGCQSMGARNPAGKSSGLPNNPQFKFEKITQFDPADEFGQIDMERRNISHLEAVTTPAKDAVLVLVKATKGSKFYLFNAEGALQWKFPAGEKQFLEAEFFGAPVYLAGTGQFAAMSSFGRIIYLDAKSGQSAGQKNMVDDQGMLTINKTGPFEQLSVDRDGETLIATSNSGKIFFVKDKKVTKTVRFKCKDEAAKCYFWSPILVRNDGVMMVKEGNGMIIFDDKHQIENLGHGDSVPMLTDAGDTFTVAVHKASGEPGKLLHFIASRGKTTSDIPVIDVTSVLFPTKTKEGSFLFSTSDHSKYDVVELLGSLTPGQRQPVLTPLPPAAVAMSTTGIFSQPTVDDQGRIFAAALDGRVLGFSSDGKVQDVSVGPGEGRHAPILMANGNLVVINDGTIDFGNGNVRFFRVR